jgi:glyoxylase I family protein
MLGTLPGLGAEQTCRMRPTGIHHVSINVDDVAAAVEFYVGRLGLEARSDRPDFGFDGAWLSVGAQQVHLIAAPPPAGLGQHFAIAVDDLDAVVEELQGVGLEVSAPSPVGPLRQSFLHDPSGNLVELSGK